MDGQQQSLTQLLEDIRDQARRRGTHPALSLHVLPYGYRATFGGLVTVERPDAIDAIKLAAHMAEMD
jgi:hypothetical protein